MKNVQTSQVTLEGVVLYASGWKLDGQDVREAKEIPDNSSNLTYKITFKTGEVMDIVLHRSGFKLTIAGLTMSGTHRLMFQRWLTAVKLHSMDNKHLNTLRNPDGSLKP